MFSYTVRCSIKEASIAESWLQWLKAEHVQDVLNAGAEAAEIFQMDGTQVYEIRYRFDSRLDFEVYERNHAPGLRAEGLRRFPLELGLEYSRTTGRLLNDFGSRK